MDLYEYQGKQYFARFGIPTSPGGVADTVDEAVAQADAAGYPVVVKAQVKVGGRGKAGGIKLADDADEARRHADGDPRHGHQGPHRAPPVDRARLGHRQGVLRQLHPRPAGQAAPRHAVGRGRRGDRGGGGHQPRRHRQAPRSTRSTGSTRRPPAAGSTEADLDEEAREQAAELLVELYRCYVEGDCDLAEINPLILTTDGRVHALDAKVTLDENATFRHPEWEEYADDRDRRPPRADGQGEGPQLHRAVGLGRHHRQRRRAGHEHARRGDPGRGHRGQLPGHRRRRQRRRDGGRAGGHQRRPGGAGRSSSTSSGASPGSTRWPRGSSRPSTGSTSARPIVLRLDGTNAEAGPGAARPAPVRPAAGRAHHARGRPPGRRPGR